MDKTKLEIQRIITRLSLDDKSESEIENLIDQLVTQYQAISKRRVNELKTIGKIAKRACLELGVQNHMSLVMDIEYTHKINPLRLNELLEADTSNFAHDISGIHKNFNRETLILENCFIPRYSA